MIFWHVDIVSDCLDNVVLFKFVYFCLHFFFIGKQRNLREIELSNGNRFPSQFPSLTWSNGLCPQTWTVVITLTMMMTIWWSKATRLLEFSRSLQGSVDLEHAAEKRDTFCVTGGRTDRGIGYSSSWILDEKDGRR